MKITRLVGSRAAKAAVGATLGLVMLTGCNGSFAGLGQMNSANPTSRTKATLGFSVTCNASTQKVSGTLTYLDSAARTSITAKASDTYSFVSEDASCDNDQMVGQYQGTYSGTVNGTRSTGVVRFTLANNLCGPGLAEVAIQIGDGFGQESFNGGPSYFNEGCMTTGYVTSLSPRSSSVLR